VTWLRGATTWGTLAYDLTRLITGEMPDGQGVTAAAGDRWVREDSRQVTDAVTTTGTTTISSASAGFTAGDVGSFVTAPGVPAGAAITAVTNATTATMSAAATATGAGVTAQIHTDSIRTPPVSDVDSGIMANRAGYFTSIGSDALAATALATPATASVRVTTPVTGTVPVAWGTRWLIRLNYPGSNPVAGNYSGVTIYWWVINLDTGAVPVNGTSLGQASAAGVINLGYGCTVTISDPSGIVPPDCSFVRAFSTAYPAGVDWWPMLHRASGPVTFGTPPPATKDTDWQISEVSTASSTGGYSQLATPGNLLHGLGIKTAAGLGSNDRYTVSWPMAMGKARIMNHGVTPGMLSLDVGGSRKDATGSGVMRNAGGMRLGYWARPFLTTASVTAASAVEYFLSVTGDGFVLVLNGDPAAPGAGRLTTAFYCAYQPADPQFDVFPMVFNGGVPADYSTDVNTAAWFHPGTQFPYRPLRRRVDPASATGMSGRDWQTGLMRGEAFYYMPSVNLGGAIGGDTISLNTERGNYSAPMYLTALGMDSSGTAIPGTAPAQQNKPGPDGNWWLYPSTLGEGFWGLTNAADDSRVMRGVMDRFAFIPEGGWVSGDELDAGADGRWLLVKPDYAGAGTARIRTTTSTYQGGVAIREV
jgi:hypothetical protein